MYVFIMSNTEKVRMRNLYTLHIHEKKKKRDLSSFSVLQVTDLLDQISFFIIELFVIRT